MHDIQYIIYRNFGMVVLSTCVNEERGKGEGGTFGLACFFFDVVGI